MLVLIAGAASAYFGLVRSTEQTVEVTVLPPIAQPGADPASSDEAVGAVAATVEPAAEGREVVLEAKGDGGWQEEATAEQDADGRVEFLLPAGGLDGTRRTASPPPAAMDSRRPPVTSSPATCGASPTSTTSSTATR